jgi:hypothetical protein
MFASVQELFRDAHAVVDFERAPLNHSSDGNVPGVMSDFRASRSGKMTCLIKFFLPPNI